MYGKILRWRAGRLRAAVGALLAALCVGAGAATSLTILETSDVHGHIHDWDFFSRQHAWVGLAGVATIVKRERAREPDLLLLDGGDTIQGTPLVYLYNVRKTMERQPMAVAMNAMKYDGMAVGNHDFDFGQAVLRRFVQDAKFPVMSANILGADGQPVYTPWIVKTVKGVKVGIFALTTPGVPLWERPEHIAGLRFEDPIEAARRCVAELRRQGAVAIVALVHGGPHRRPADDKRAEAWLAEPGEWKDRGDLEEHNCIIPLAEQVPGIHVLLSGHTHLCIPEARIGGVLLVQPSSWGRGVAKVTLTIEQGKEVVAARGEFLDAERVPPDREMVALTARHQEAALAYVRTVVATAAGAFPGGFAARCQDGPLADLINHVQLGMAEAAGFPAQISATSIFTEEGHLDPGPVRLADLYALYPYENTLTVLEISGRTLRQALEHNARYWKTWDVAGPPPDGLASLVSEGAKPYGWDLYSGVAFKLDLSKPAGRRVAELRCGGQAVTPEQTYRIALNNYRAGGGGGFWMFRDAKAVWRSESEIRDALVQHVTAAGRLAPESYFTANWAFLPESLNPPGGTSDRETPAAASAP